MNFYLGVQLTIRLRHATLPRSRIQQCNSRAPIIRAARMTRSAKTAAPFFWRDRAGEQERSLAEFTLFVLDGSS
ncbi:hypothetical protein E4K64_27785 [Bradyrhizobium frederickii]|uniref:Uncharacterized protein n=1 Tax=Bradyrhizobium frederickii TaxID=2560054 RepID=A0A4Y9NVE3_9BRAD|nr:hypothetical protein [Bradyrhizobium frederickii]TFV71218.1 hypothetical protein E4K64_27785 [Bradyrhizobium frederickii]